MASVDPSAVRYTQDVDILIRRSDLPAAIEAMKAAGFVYRHVASIDMFLDGPQGRARDAIHTIFSAEKVREEYLFPAPEVDESKMGEEGYRYLSLEALVRMKLTSYRDKDRTHLRDFIDVGLIDASWPARLPKPLDERLQALLDTPEG